MQWTYLHFVVMYSICWNSFNYIHITAKRNQKAIQRLTFKTQAEVAKCITCYPALAVTYYLYIGPIGPIGLALIHKYNRVSVSLPFFEFIKKKKKKIKDNLTNCYTHPERSKIILI